MQIDIDFTPTPEQLATAFAHMCSDDQASFLAHVSDIAETWDLGIEGQLSWVASSYQLTDGAKGVMEAMGAAIKEEAEGP